MKRFNTVKSLVSILLALMMLLPCLVSCADTGTAEVTTAPVTATTTEGSGDSVIEETTRDTLPELDFGGEEVNILYWENANNNEFFVEETDGTDINDVVYRRNENVQDRLNFKFAWNGQKGAKGNLESFVTYMRTGIDSGENIEIVAVHSMVMGAVAAEGYLQNLGDVDHINLDSPWWPEDLVENSTIKGNIFFVSGDISLNTLLGMEGVFFNKDMTESDLYSHVHNKTWTIEQMFNESKDAYKDSTGDGKSDDDVFGYITYSGMINAMCIGMGIRITDKDEEGFIKLSDTYVSEKTQTLIEMLNSYFYNNNAWYYTPKSWNGAAETFSDGRALFTMASVRYTVNELAGSDVTYGILPAPLYNTDQESYHTLMANTYTMFGISIGCKDTTRPGAVIEAMASEGYHTVTPVVFEVALKARYSDDSSDAMMFDVLRESVVMEIGLVFSDMIGGLPSKALFTLVNNKNADWMSYMKQYDKKINGKNGYLDKLNQAFDN
ncbi:MAG: hypothetical protein IJD70_07145 [Clostridia bacterium]|nr:hypothetical protein [Clostridia bacterium]